MGPDPIEQLLVELLEAGVELIVVGGLAAVFLGVPVVTFDLDIVHRRTPDNVERLLAVLLSRGAFHRLDLANPRLPPTREALLGRGHLNLSVDEAKLDVLCEIDPDWGYEELLVDAQPMPFHGQTLQVLGLRRLIQAKIAAGRPKDRVILPLLVATLEASERKG